ncbi:MAG: class I SAM-dependent methyltransferase [Vicinamibacterales bacterium]
MRGLLRSQLNPLTSWFMPFRHVTARRLEAYYRRTLSDVGLAERWAAHYLGGLDIPAGAAVLDHGSGRGRHIAILQRLGYRVSGQDMAGHAWWDRLRPASLQVVPPAAPRLPWRDGSFHLVLDVEVLHYLDEASLARHVAEVHRVLAAGGYWVLVEANDQAYGAFLPRRFMGRLHSEEVIRRLTAHRFSTIDAGYEGVYAPYVPRLVNFIRQQAWPGPYDPADYGSWLERRIPARRRAMWRMRLRKIT